MLSVGWGRNADEPTGVADLQDYFPDYNAYFLIWRCVPIKKVLISLILNSDYNQEILDTIRKFIQKLGWINKRYKRKVTL